MPIRAIVFDIGGVLEVTPRTGWEARWEARLGLPPGGLDEQLMPVWRGGSDGTLTEAEVEQGIALTLGLDPATLAAFTSDLWAEYLGTLNEELVRYFAGLRPRFRTGILSNSFAGARRREQAAYGFEDLCDVVIYSHEEGLRKPDPRFFDLACQRLGVAPAEMVFLDDVDVIVRAARDFGIHAIQFQSTAQAIAEITQYIEP